MPCTGSRAAPQPVAGSLTAPGSRTGSCTGSRSPPRHLPPLSAPAPVSSPGPVTEFQGLFINLADPAPARFAGRSDRGFDTTVDPSISNVQYSRPYLIYLPTSFADGKLTLLDHTGANGGHGGLTNLGGLNPSAGGDEPQDKKKHHKKADLNDLSPAAGGEETTAGANSFLDGGWLLAH